MKIVTKYFRIFVGYSYEFDDFRFEYGVGEREKERGINGLFNRRFQGHIALVYRKYFWNRHVFPVGLTYRFNGRYGAKRVFDGLR